MADSKINILGIVPYESMKNVLLRAAENYPQVHIDVYVGNLQEGVNIINRTHCKNYDVILSRGGTIDLIRRATSIPVVDIPLSSLDIIRTLELAQNISDRFVIVAFPNIAKNVKMLVDIFKYDIPVITIRSQEEVKLVLEKLRAEGTPMVISDTITNITARKLDINSVLLTSGSESLNTALQQAINLIESFSNTKSENLLFREILMNDTSKVVIFDKSQNLFYSTWNGETEEFFSFLQQSLPDVLQNSLSKFFHVIDQTLYYISTRLIHTSQNDYAVYFVQSAKVPMISSKYGISFLNRRQTEQIYYNGSFSLHITRSDIGSIIQQYSETPYPVMITGEEGTGKEQAANLLYLSSPSKNNPYIVINCSVLTAKSWEFLTNHYHSPLNEEKNTIYFKHINDLSDDRCAQLLSIALGTDLHHRNRLIFSCSCSKTGQLPANALKIISTLSCLRIQLSPVRDQKTELASLFNIYLTSQNEALGKQIIGFNSSAMDLLLRFDWPGNFTQVKRVISSLCVITNTSYITTASVKRVFDQEVSANTSEQDAEGASKNLSQGINLNRPLASIIQDIVKQAVAQNHGNQSATARQLGISRTTLWRYINHAE